MKAIDTDLNMMPCIGLGDATWSVSSGIGTCAAAGLYEVGRPERLSGQEAETLDAQWQEFGKQQLASCM